MSHDSYIDMSHDSYIDMSHDSYISLAFAAAALAHDSCESDASIDIVLRWRRVYTHAHYGYGYM